MRRAILASGIVGITLSVIYLGMAMTYSRGTPAKPGPGLYPLFVGFLFLAGSVGTVVTALVRPAEGSFAWPKGSAWRRVCLVTFAVFAYMLLLPIVGYLPTAAVVVLATLHGMDMPSWPRKIGVAIAFALVSYYLFGPVLSVPLPRGIWFH